MDMQEVNHPIEQPVPQVQESGMVDPIAAAPSPTSTSGNTSGQGSTAVVPEEVKGWSWGGFLMTWIWGVFNGVWLSLLALMFPAIMSIVLGIKGREWAWQSKKWDSVEHFNRTQKNWAVAGLILTVIPIAVILLLIILVAMNPAGQLQSSTP